MNRIPFRKFIITLLVCGKTVNDIVQRLRSFNYYTTPDDVANIFSDIRNVVPPSINELFDVRQLLRVDDETHMQWLKHFGIFEVYDYIIRGNNNVENPPGYFKWVKDCVWAHTHKDVMSLINIFLFNEEPLDTISDVIYVKYKKKIGVDALKLYSEIYWDTTNMSAKEALICCLPFQHNALIIRQFRSGNAELEMNNINSEAHDGCDVPFNFHDSEYIKWKVGYKQFEAPTPKDFLEKIQVDSMYKYYEAMNMACSIEIEEEEGTNDMGSFDNRKTRRRNVEEQRVKIAKQWLDLYIKAKEHMPGDKDTEKSFFEKMKELELNFDDTNEKIAQIEDMPDVADDIKGDMNPS